MISTTAAFVALAAAIPGALRPQPEPGPIPPAVTYTVRLDKPQTQTAIIEYTAPAGDNGLEVALPTWRPGKYEILDMAGTIRWLRAFDAAGAELPVAKTTKNQWRVDAAPGTPVTVRYELYANSIADRTRHIDDTHAFLSPSGVMVFAPEHREKPLTVTLEGPEDWSVGTGLDTAATDTPRTLSAPNYDTLVDSPIEFGRQIRTSYEVEGVPHELVIWGEPGWTQKQLDDLTKDFRAITVAQHALFRSFPYDRYVFLLHVAPGLRGGTEHINSTVMSTRAEVLRTEDSKRNLLGLASHELFHAWNVKSFRPGGLSPYDYTRENYTTQLWIAEGTTTYYDDLMLVRAGLMTPKQYLDTIKSTVNGEATRPGRAVQSLADSSFDAWIKFNKRWPDSLNSTVNFYSKGAMASLILDMRIREATDNDRSLDDVMRTLYQRFPRGGPGYTPEDFRLIVDEVASDDLSDFFDNYITGTEELPMAEALATAGLTLTSDKTTPDLTLGLELAAADGGSLVTAVRTDGPAYEAGLIADDVIIAVNGQRLRNLSEALKDLDKAGNAETPLTLTVFRRDRLREFVITPIRSAAGFKLEHAKDPTALQKAIYRSWLGQSWPGDNAKEDAKDSSTDDGASDDSETASENETAR